MHSGGIKLCDKHFIKGKPADLYDVTNPDWAPSQKMGHRWTRSVNNNRYQRAKNRQQMKSAYQAAQTLIELHKSTLKVAATLESCTGVSGSKQDNYKFCTTSCQTDLTMSTIKAMEEELQQQALKIRELQEAAKKKKFTDIASFTNQFTL